MSGPQLLAAVVAAFVVTQLAIFTTTVYLHRALTHRALTVHPVAAFPCRCVIWMTTGMRPREWVAVHRKHHAATDTADDPHSPLVVGFWRVQLGNVGLYKRAAADDEMMRKYARDIPTDRFDRLAFDYSLVGLGIGITILVRRDVGARLRSAHRLRRGRPARGALRDARGRDQRRRAPVRRAAVRELGDEPAGRSRSSPVAKDCTTTTTRRPRRRASRCIAARSIPGWWVVRVLVALHLAHVRHEDVHLKRAA